jgi:hypothetical protein
VNHLKTDSFQRIFAFLVIVACAALRFAPHPADFSPVFGALIFSGMAFPRWRGLLVPMSVFILTDIFVTPLVYHVHIGWTQGIVWLALAAVVTTGRLLHGHLTVRRGVLVTWLAPTLFWIIANFGVWLGGTLYPRTSAGLTQCYAAAIPFYKHAVVSTVLVGTVIFGLYAILVLRNELRVKLMHVFQKSSLASHP